MSIGEDHKVPLGRAGRPFTKNSFPAGNMPNKPTEAEKLNNKIDLLKDALNETFRQIHVVEELMKIAEFKITNIATERDVALAEVERLKGDLEVAGLQLKASQNEVTVVKKELKRCQLEAFEETDSRFKTGG